MARALRIAVIVLACTAGCDSPTAPLLPYEGIYAERSVRTECGMTDPPIDSFAGAGGYIALRAEMIGTPALFGRRCDLAACRAWFHDGMLSTELPAGLTGTLEEQSRQLMTGSVYVTAHGGHAASLDQTRFCIEDRCDAAQIETTLALAGGDRVTLTRKVSIAGRCAAKLTLGLERVEPRPPH